MTLSDILSPAIAAAFGSFATLVTQAIDRHHKNKDKKGELAVEDAKLLHQSEVEFRKALLLRINQLERHDEEKNKHLAAQAQRIHELEIENGQLKAKLAQLEKRP